MKGKKDWCRKNIGRNYVYNFPSLVRHKYIDSKDAVTPDKDKCKENHAHKHHNKTAEKQISKNLESNTTYRKTIYYLEEKNILNIDFSSETVEWDTEEQHFKVLKLSTQNSMSSENIPQE